MTLVCNQLKAYKASGNKTLEANKLINLATDALGKLCAEFWDTLCRNLARDAWMPSMQNCHKNCNIWLHFSYISRNNYKTTMPTE